MTKATRLMMVVLGLALLSVWFGAQAPATVGQETEEEMDLQLPALPTDDDLPLPPPGLQGVMEGEENGQDVDSDSNANEAPAARQDAPSDSSDRSAEPGPLPSPAPIPESPNFSTMADMDPGFDVGVPSPGYCNGYWWVRPEYLLWWVEGFRVPPLVTSSPVGTDRELAGLLDQPTTTILLGNTRVADEARSGGRIRFGLWLDPCATCGVEASYYGLGDHSCHFRADSDEFPILARPFYNLTPDFEGPAAELVAFPEQLEGTVSVHGETSLHGVEVLYRQALCCTCACRFDFLVGWRYNQLDDELLISDFKRVISGDTGLQVGTTVEEYDRFATRNSFSGAELGLVAEWSNCRWNLELLMKLGLGRTRACATIDGSTTVTVPDPDVAIMPTGLLALPTNIGAYTRDKFAVIPEVGITVGYNLTCNLRATFSYSFMYWSWVARPGDQIDMGLNLSQLEEGSLVGPARPEFTWVDTDLWIQGLGFGLDYRF
jgi:hypothetical protein